MTAVLSTTKLTEIFIACDDFMNKFKSHQLSHGYQLEPETRLMSESEMMAILIFYHHSGLRCFKFFYELGVQRALRSYFPARYSYSRFVSLVQRLNLPLFVFLCACRLAAATRGNYVDSTKLVVCHNKRIFRHKVLKGLARRGKSSTGWFFGLKLHAVINELGQLVVFRVTSGNVADNSPQLLGQLTERLEGFLYGDAGYISSIAQGLRDRGLELITKLRSNMKPQELTPEQKHYLRHRGLIESVFSLLKGHCDIDHTRHRSPSNFFINLWAGLVAYSFMDKFPSMPKFLPKAGEGGNTQIVLA